MKVKIKSLGLPTAAYGQQVDYGLSLGRGMEGDPSGSLKPKRTIGGVPREEANLEAEGGETVVGQISGDGIVDHMIIKGPRHSSGGVPMNLPDDSFIFSDTASMKIKDPQILQMFGKSKGSYTPAELAKPYDISKYKAILMDPDTDRLSRNTAEIMIKNIVMKLGALSLAQEAKKGFPQGIPEIAKPYMEANGISEEDLIPELKAQAEQMQAMQQQQAMQMQQAQGMQQPQGPSQGMPPMMPDGQPVAMPQQGMAPPQQPMMDPRQMMAMQQEQQMMPPQPQQGMPMADRGIIVGDDEFIPPKYPLTEEEAARVKSGQDYKNSMFIKDNRIFNDVFRDRVKEQDRMTYGGTPMAAYGMQLGGYDMPFIMGTGGMMRYHNGGEGEGHPHKAGTKTIIVKNEDGTTTEIQATPSEALSYENRAETTDGYQGAYKIDTKVIPGQEADAADAANTNEMAEGAAEEAAWKNGLCDSMKPGGSRHNMKPSDVAREHAPADYDNMLAFLIACQGNSEKFDETTEQTTVGEYIDDSETTEESCQCQDKDGNPIEGLVVKVSEIPEGIECGTKEFNEMFCVENYEEIVERREQDGLAMGTAMPTFKEKIDGVNKASVPGAKMEQNTYDYKSRVQQIQGMLDDQKKNTRGLGFAQELAANAYVAGQGMDKMTSEIDDTIRNNTLITNKMDEAVAAMNMNVGKMKLANDNSYNAAEYSRKAQETKNSNDQKQFKYNARRKQAIDDITSRAVNSLGTNFDLAGRYRNNGIPINANVNMNTNDAMMTQYNTYVQTDCGGKNDAECKRKFAESMQLSKFGGSSSPYIMASSVYPFIT